MLSQTSSRLVLSALVLGLSSLVTFPAFAVDPAPATQPAGKKAAPIKSATFVPGQGFQVNSKPFFPVMLYSAKTSPEELAEFHKQGYNVLTVNKPEDAEKAWGAGFYLAQHAYPKKPPTQVEGTLFGIGMDSPMLNFKKDPIAQSKEDLEKVQKLLPDRPVFHAIGYWVNEPEGVEKNVLPSAAQYDDLVNTIDVSAPYLYPVPYQPISTVGDAVARARKASAGKKAILPILQLFTWDKDLRYPTPAELREMVWLAVAAGADGIGYYDYSYVSGKKDTNIAKEQPELWKTAGSINADLNFFASKIAGLKEVTPTATLKEPKPGQATIRQWGSDKKGALLLVNTGEEPVTAGLKFSGSQSVTSRIIRFNDPEGHASSNAPASNLITTGVPAHSKILILWGDAAFTKF